MEKRERKRVIYTAQSKYYYYAKMMIAKYVLEHDAIPLNPFNNWSYFMNDMVERELVVCANTNLVYISDEIWVFGPIADGVLAEIRLGKELGKSIKFFSVGKTYEEIQKIEIENLIFEKEILMRESKDSLLKEFLDL